MLEIRSDKRTWTDTNAIFLPDAIGHFDSEKLNFHLFKATCAYLLAQNRFGTFRIDERTGAPVVCEAVGRYRDQQRALRLFEAVEQERISMRLKHEFPGLGRQLEQLNTMTGRNKSFSPYLQVIDTVRRLDADVNDTLNAVDVLYHRKADIPQPTCFQGMIDLEAVRLTARSRVDNEKKKFRNDLSVLAQNLKSETPYQRQPDIDETSRFRMEPEPTADSQSHASDDLVLTVDGQPVKTPQDMVQTTSEHYSGLRKNSRAISGTS